MELASADVASFWIVDQDETVGLVRLLDLDDIGEGQRFDSMIFGMLRTEWTN